MDPFQPSVKPGQHGGEVVGEIDTEAVHLGFDGTEGASDIEDGDDLVGGSASGEEETATILGGSLATALGEVEGDAGGGTPELIGEMRLAPGQAVDDARGESGEFETEAVDSRIGVQHADLHWLSAPKALAQTGA